MSQRDYSEGAAFPLVAVAIDKDKGSQNALKWALDNIISRGQTITLIHVNTGKTPSCKSLFLSPSHISHTRCAGAHIHLRHKQIKQQKWRKEHKLWGSGKNPI